MEEEQIQQPELKVDEHTLAQLAETAKWSRLLGGAGILMGISLLFLSFNAGEAIAKLGNASGLPAGISPSIIASMYLVMGLVVIAVSFFLMRFGNRMRIAINFKRQDYFNHALHSLKLSYRILGILLIAYFVLSLVEALFFGRSIK